MYFEEAPSPQSSLDIKLRSVALNYYAKYQLSHNTIDNMKLFN